MRRVIMARERPSHPQPKPWIAAIHAYVPGKAKAADGRPLVKLSANENPLGCSGAALTALREPHDPAQYPDPDATELRAAIGALHGLDPAHIVCARAPVTCSVWRRRPLPVLVMQSVFARHSFSLYEVTARRCGALPVEAPDSDYGADVDALLACVSERTRVVFIANPNNPTGSYLPHDEIIRLHAGLPSDVLLVLDQAYAEYVDPAEAAAGLILAQQHGNVLVTRTFSKIYGLAGERIGWATGAPDIIANLNRIRGPFNVTNSGQAAAIAGLADQAFVAQTRDHNAHERARFVKTIESLGNHGLRALPSEGNFVMVLFEGALSAERALDAIADAGFAVRHFPGGDLDHALRITIGTVAQMDVIAATLRELAERTP